MFVRKNTNKAPILFNIGTGVPVRRGDKYINVRKTVLQIILAMIFAFVMAGSVGASIDDRYCTLAVSPSIGSPELCK